jgi:hypothetical protein
MKVKDMKRIINLIVICSVSSFLYGSEQQPKVFSLKNDLLLPGLAGMAFPPMVIAVFEPTMCKKLVMEQPREALTILGWGFLAGAGCGCFGYMKKPRLLSGNPSMQNQVLSERATTVNMPKFSPLSMGKLSLMRNNKTVDYTKE